MNKNLKNILFGLSVVVAVVFGVLYFNSLALFGAAGTGTSFYQTPNFLQGLYAGTLGQFRLTNAGVLTSSGAATLSGATTLTGAVTIQDASASSTLALAGVGGCIAIPMVGTTTLAYWTATSTSNTVLVSTTKPASCK